MSQMDRLRTVCEVKSLQWQRLQGLHASGREHATPTCVMASVSALTAHHHHRAPWRWNSGRCWSCAFSTRAATASSLHAPHGHDSRMTKLTRDCSLLSSVP